MQQLVEVPLEGRHAAVPVIMYVQRKGLERENSFHVFPMKRKSVINVHRLMLVVQSETGRVGQIQVAVE